MPNAVRITFCSIALAFVSFDFMLINLLDIVSFKVHHMPMSARIKLKHTRLDDPRQIGANGSRREKARLKKAVVRLANCANDADFVSFQKAFPDLFPRDVAGLRPRPAERIRNASLGVRAAWRVPDGSLRRAVLAYQVGTYYSDIVGLIAQTGNLPPVFRVWPRPGEPGKEKCTTFAEHSAGPLQMWQERVSLDNFFRVLVQALDSRHAMRLCANPECPHPFYLRSEGGKRFCSKACAGPSTRNRKLEWWNAHKKELLARRKAERKRRKRARRRKARNPLDKT